MHYYTRHLGDYAKDTGHLTLLEHGVYTVLLDWSYSTERPLPASDEELFRICRAFTREEKSAVLRVISEFFTGDQEERRNKRCQAEITAFAQKSAKATRSAALRWQCERTTNVSKTDMQRARAFHKPITNNQYPSSPTPQPPSQPTEPEVSPYQAGGGGAVDPVGFCPSDEEVFEFGAGFKGELATGTTGPIPQAFVAQWLALMHGRREFPARWQRGLIAEWRKANQPGGSTAAKAGLTTSRRAPEPAERKNGALVSRKISLERALTEARDNEEAALQTGDGENEPRFRKERQRLEQELAAVQGQIADTQRVAA